MWPVSLLAVLVLVASGRCSLFIAGVVGLVLAVVTAFVAGPTSPDLGEILTATLQGAWVGSLVASVILAGLLFREVVHGEAPSGSTPTALVGSERRRSTFRACFILGPFNEVATGFGTGQITAGAALRPTALPAERVVPFALFSQMLNPWGALGTGTVLGGELAGVPPGTLGYYSSLLMMPILLGWLVAFWRFAANAGLTASTTEHARELIVVAVIAILLAPANLLLGPEVCALAVLGVVMPFVLPRQSMTPQVVWRSLLRTVLPYVGFVVGLAATRTIPSVGVALRDALAISALPGAPPLYPLMHPTAWLLGVALVTAGVTGRLPEIGTIIGRCAARGWRPAASTVVFIAIAQVLVASGIAQGGAVIIGDAFGPGALLLTPVLAGLAGVLTGSSNAANALLMPSQVALAHAHGASLVWVAAIQNTACATSTLLAPMRVALGCSLVGRKDLEGYVYRVMWPLGAIASAVLLVAAGVIIRGRPIP